MNTEYHTRFSLIRTAKRLPHHLSSPIAITDEYFTYRTFALYYDRFFDGISSIDMNCKCDIGFGFEL